MIVISQQQQLIDEHCGWEQEQSQQSQPQSQQSQLHKSLEPHMIIDVSWHHVTHSLHAVQLAQPTQQVEHSSQIVFAQSVQQLQHSSPQLQS